MEYPIEVVLKTAEITNQDVSNWIRNGFVRQALPPSTKGKKRTFTRLNVYEFAILAELKRAGMQLLDSAQIAAQIIDTYLSKSDDELEREVLCWNPMVDDLRVFQLSQKSEVATIFRGGRVMVRDDFDWDAAVEGTIEFPDTSHPTTMIIFAPHALKQKCDKEMADYEK